MNEALVLYIGCRTLETALLLAAPVLCVMMAVGFLVAMLQAVTTIRDMTVGMVIKLGCLGLTLLFLGGWMMEVAVGFAHEVFNHLQTVGS